MNKSVTFANVCSVTALVLAMGGVGYAATVLPANSVGTVQLKSHAVTGAKVKPGSLTGADIKASTIGNVRSSTNAAKLGGIAASGYLKSSSPAGGDLSGTLGNAQLGDLPYGYMNLTDGQCGSVYDDTAEFETSTVSTQGGVTASADTGCNDGSTQLTVNRTGIYDITTVLSWSANPTGLRRTDLYYTTSGQSCEDAITAGQILGSNAEQAVSEADRYTILPLSVVTKLTSGDGVCAVGDALDVSAGSTALNGGPATFLSLAFLSNAS